jgi:putative DNA primase/helicase
MNSERPFSDDEITAALEELEKPPPRKRQSRSRREGNRLDAAPEFTEDALALRFAELYAHELRYVAIWGKWLIWDATRWRFEHTLAAFDMARKICREAARKCKKPSDAKTLSKAKTIAAVEMLARSDRRMAATKDQWDTGLLRFNT